MIKRLFEVALASMALILLSPLLLLLALAIKMDSSGPVFFRQIRVGLNGSHFTILKFRTMIENAERLGLQISEKQDPRVTTVGQVLRKYKLDELPQLLNILMGEMSFVGPRPEVPRYVEMFPDLFAVTLSVKPGLTDYASLEFMDEAELLAESEDSERIYIEDILPKKLALSECYVHERSLLTDLVLVFRTVGRLAR